MGFEPETIKLESGGQGNFLKFFQKEFYSKQGGYLREKNIFDTKKNIFGRFWKKWTSAGSNPVWVDLILHNLRKFTFVYTSIQKNSM